MTKKRSESLVISRPAHDSWTMNPTKMATTSAAINVDRFCRPRSRSVTVATC